jgi:ATP-dependent DNA helicase RecG
MARHSEQPMNPLELERILHGGEGITVEFKLADGGVPKSLYETIAAFSNLDGGTIVLGVDDEGHIHGIPDDRLSRYQQDIVNQLNNPDCIDPPLSVQPRSVTHAFGNVIVLQLPASSQLHTHVGRVYLRGHEGDMDVTQDHEAVRQIHLRKSNYFTEGEIYKDLHMSDLDPDLFAKARDLIRGYQSSHPWLYLSDEDLLRSASLWRKDYKTGKEGLTLAAALIFGNDPTLQSLLPAYKVDVLVRRENLDRYDDRLLLRTNLIDTYRQTLEFVKKYFPEKFFTEGSQRKDLRDLIFREVVGNLIVHREYTNSISTEIVIYNDRVACTNPTKPHFHGPIDPACFNPYPKNPNIRKFFTAFGWTDELGSGVRNTHKYLPLYAQGATPIFIENDIFITEIPMARAMLVDYRDSLLSWLDLDTDAASHLQEGLSTVAVDASLVDAGWDQALLTLVPSWNEKSVKLPALGWPDYEPLAEEPTQEEPRLTKTVSSARKENVNSPPKKLRYLLAILVLTAAPVKLEQMMEWIGYRNRQTFRTNYLKPLMQVGFVRMTIPDKPRAANQQYLLTPTGALFLGGKAS